jgi:peptidyl-prolyl cis-trans isomerase SurA
MRHLTILALGLALALLPAPPLVAQGLFSPAAVVDGTVITRWQVEERARFLALLRAPGAGYEGARDALIDETIQARAAREAGIEVTPEELEQGLAEFASRGNLSPEQFVEVLTQAGVAAETFRDFVRNGLLWRELIQARFGSRARPSDAQVDRTLARGDARAGVEVLLSEIALPVTPQNRVEVTALAERLSATLRGEAAFADAARRFSRAPTAPSGGRLDPISLAELAPPVAEQVIALPDGGVSEPVNFGSFIGIFLLRGLREGDVPPPETLTVDYAEVLIPGGRSPEALQAAAGLSARADTCGDLYGLMRDQPPERLIRRSVARDALPPDLRQVLATLDPGEVSTLLTAQGTLRLVMLCERVAEASDDERRALGQRLLSGRLEGYAEAYLEELRADARIERL